MVRWVVRSILHGVDPLSFSHSNQYQFHYVWNLPPCRVRYSSVVRAFAHGGMGRRIDPSWGEPIELFLVPASAPQLV